jgi:hypothetical protein
MKQLHILGFALLTLCQPAMACSWVPMSFCETSNARPEDVVISGKILSVDEDGMDLEVIHVLKGIESNQIIRIWDGTDFDCNGLFSMSASMLGSVDDTIIVVMPLITEIENTWDVVGDYRRPDYFGVTTELQVANGIISGYIWGPISAPIWQMPYQDLIANWSEGPDGCAVFLSVGGGHAQEPFSAILVDHMLKLSIPSRVGSGSVVRIYALNGQELVMQAVTAGNAHLDVSGLAAGGYYVLLVQPDGSRNAVRVMKG